MKKSLFLAVIMLLSATASFSQSGTIGDLTWTLSNGTLTISGTGIIPAGSPWTSHPDITTDDITKIVVGEGITAIGNDAFEYLTEVTSVIFPNSLTSIGNGAFMSCRGIAELPLPHSLRSIGNWAFAYCYGLTSITLPDLLTTIGESAFFYCTAITSITIPGSVTDIGESAFSSCKKLTGFTVVSENRNFSSSNGVLFNAERTSLFCYPIAKPETSYTVPDGVQKIETDAFSECTGLTSIILPHSLTTIGTGAFGYNPQLTSFVIPPSVIEIGRTAFWNCSGLGYIMIPSSVINIGNQAFAHCKGLKSVIVSWDDPSYVHFPSGGNLFDGVTTSAIKLHVPTGTEARYRNASVWQYFDITGGSEGFNLALSSLIVSKGSLYPAFDPSCLSYTVSVGYSETSINLSATPVQASYAVSGAGEKMLEVGENIFPITVTAESGETQTYTVTVFRLAGECTLTEDGFTNKTVKEDYYVAPHSRTFTFDVIVGRYQYYILETSNVSGNLPFHFDFGNGISCDRNIAVQPYGRYKITFDISTNPGNPRKITTPYDAYGNPSAPYISYTMHDYVLTASEGNNIVALSVMTFHGTLTAVSVSDVTFEGNTGIHSAKSNPLQFFPNPAGDRLSLSGLQGNETLRVYNIGGSLLYSDKATGETETVSIAHLPAGMYFISIQSNERISTYKFIKK